ncbi:MAG: hypothetical protein ACOYN5_15925 [Bacteroidales bacterium]
MNSPEHWKQEAQRLSATNPLQSLFATSHYHLQLDDATGCIKTYTKAVDSIIIDANQNGYSSIATEISILEKFPNANLKLTKQIKLYLAIAVYLIADRSDKNHSIKQFEHHKIRNEHFKTPVVIIAGGASFMDKTKLDSYREFIRELMHDFKGTIISGGTTAGIPGLVGEVKSALQKEGPVDFDLVAYLPVHLPVDSVKSPAYDRFNETESDTFSVLEVLSYWNDLIGNGIAPKNVIVLGIEGGEIAAMEYRIALSLGAELVLVANSGRAASELLTDENWKNHPNLKVIPNDPLIIRTLVNP